MDNYTVEALQLFPAQRVGLQIGIHKHNQQDQKRHKHREKEQHPNKKIKDQVTIGTNTPAISDGLTALPVVINNSKEYVDNQAESRAGPHKRIDIKV